MKRLMIPILICLLVLSGCAAQSTGKEGGSTDGKIGIPKEWMRKEG